jgi:hypothetical protein
LIVNLHLSQAPTGAGAAYVALVARAAFSDLPWSLFARNGGDGSEGFVVTGALILTTWDSR